MYTRLFWLLMRVAPYACLLVLLGAFAGMGSAFVKNDMLQGTYFAVAILMGFHAITLWLFLLVASDIRECHERLRAIQGDKPIGEKLK